MFRIDDSAGRMILGLLEASEYALGPCRRSFSEEQLLARLESEGCLVCYELAKSDTDYFFWPINEDYAEPELLDALSAALGFV
jgi:hypothetical protein